MSLNPHCLLPVVQGSFLLFLPKGLTAFAILYTLGNIAAFCRLVASFPF